MNLEDVFKLAEVEDKLDDAHHVIFALRKTSCGRTIAASLDEHFYVWIETKQNNFWDSVNKESDLYQDEAVGKDDWERLEVDMTH